MASGPVHRRQAARSMPARARRSTCSPALRLSLASEEARRANRALQSVDRATGGRSPEVPVPRHRRSGSTAARELTRRAAATELVACAQGSSVDSDRRTASYGSRRSCRLRGRWRRPRGDRTCGTQTCSFIAVVAVLLAQGGPSLFACGPDRPPAMAVPKDVGGRHPPWGESLHTKKRSAARLTCAVDGAAADSAGTKVSFEIGSSSSACVRSRPQAPVRGRRIAVIGRQILRSRSALPISSASLAEGFQPTKRGSGAAPVDCRLGVAHTRRLREQWLD